jgi:hypothetical protein
MPPGLLPAAAAAILTLAVDVLYLALIHGEGGPADPGRVGFVAGSLAAAALVPPLAVRLHARVRQGLLGWAAGTVGAWALLGGFSIGLLLVPSFVLTVVAAGRGADPRPGLAAPAGVAGALAVVVLGLLFA